MASVYVERDVQGNMECVERARAHSILSRERLSSENFWSVHTNPIGLLRGTSSVTNQTDTGLQRGAVWLSTDLPAKVSRNFIRSGSIIFRRWKRRASTSCVRP